MKESADLDWYSKRSSNKKLPTRCPFGSVHRCPRYYQSLSLLGDAGSTSIDKKLDDSLKQKWEKTDLWPVTKEQATSILGNPDN